MSDLISRQAAIDALGEEPPVWYDGEDEIAERNQWRRDVTVIKELPSAQPEVRPIDYQDCSNAMLRMWMDNVVTDGEYNRIMDKLNEHEKKKTDSMDATTRAIQGRKDRRMSDTISRQAAIDVEDGK